MKKGRYDRNTDFAMELIKSKIKPNKTLFNDIIAIEVSTIGKNMNTIFLGKSKAKYLIKLENKRSTLFSVYTHTPPDTLYTIAGGGVESIQIPYTNYNIVTIFWYYLIPFSRPIVPQAHTPFAYEHRLT
jgi:hypothetical protein